MTGAVVDASVVAAWLLPDERSDSSETLLRRIQGGPLAAPFHFPAEIGNTLLTAFRRKRLDQADVETCRRDLRSLNIALDADGQDRVWPQGWILAERHGLTLYDALYLELAMRLNVPLATFDGALRRAAEAEGVRLA